MEPFGRAKDRIDSYEHDPHKHGTLPMIASKMATRPPLLRPDVLPPGWIVFALYPLYPVLWVLGFSGFAYAIALIPATMWILARPRRTLPPATGLFALYVLWAGASIVRLDRFSRVVVFGLRYAGYLCALALAYYVFYERRVSKSTLIDWVALLWVWAIAGGYLGLLMPDGGFQQTLASTVLPPSLIDNDWIQSMVRPRFAVADALDGAPLPRPAALFTHTNSWAAAVGLLTPFLLASTVCSTNHRRRVVGVALLAAALPVIILSGNRGLWLSLAVLIVAATVQSAVSGRLASVPLALVVLVVATGALVATPLGSVVSGRLAGGEASSNTRAGIYGEAWMWTKESPILGWGGPRPSTDPFSPPLGSHGHFWFAMFAHGLIGAGLYVAWIAAALSRSFRRANAVDVMLTAVVAVGFVQMFFYGAFTVPIVTILVAIGLRFRPDDTWREVAWRRADGTTPQE